MPNSKKTLFWITIIVLMVIVITIVIRKEISPPDTISPNNIIFTGENGELYLINPDDSHQKPITHANRIITGKPLPSIIYYKLPKQLVIF